MLWMFVVVVDVIIYPEWQFLAFSVYIPVPNNVVGLAAFPAAFVFFVLWKSAPQ